MTLQQFEASNSLFTESIVRWHIGDWEYLVEVGAEEISLQPDKCLIAMFKAAALFQQGALDAARTWANQAIGWGADPKMLARIMLSGAHNSLGRAALLAGWETQAQHHIKEAMRIGCIELDGVLLYPARLMQQRTQVNPKVRLGLSDIKEIQIAQKTTKEQFQAQQQKIKEKFNQAKQARTEKKYQQAEKILSEIIRLDPENLPALKENAALQAQQQKWDLSIIQYDCFLKKQKEIENAILSRSLMKKNLDFLDEAIKDLENAKALGFYNSKIAYQLALAYRDNKNYIELERVVFDLLDRYPDYIVNLSFATFFADFLRKKEKLKEAYGTLIVVMKMISDNKKEIPLNMSAIFLELQRSVISGEYSREVSSNYYDSIYSESEKYLSDAFDSIYLQVWKEVINMVRQYNNANVLDIGCGPGQFSEFLIKNIPEINYQGVDYSEKAIEVARRRCPSLNFYVKNLMAEGALDSFDVDIFIILEVLEHIELDLDLIKSLPKGKIVIFSVPNMDSAGHVRFFKDIHEVRSRYGELCNINSAVTINLKGRSKIFLIHAVTK